MGVGSGMRTEEEGGKLKKEDQGEPRTISHGLLCFVCPAITDIHIARWRCRSI